MIEASKLWQFLVFGYFLTVAIEGPILFWGLSPRHSVKRKVLAAFWLTACTYPIVVLVMPLLFWQPFGKVVYLVIAETFAPLAECVLFRVVDMDDEAGLFRSRVRDCVAIVVANLASFLLGGWLVGMWLSHAA